jgi:hypothetical protein
MKGRKQQIADHYYGILGIVKELRKRGLNATADHMMNELQDWCEKSCRTAPTLYEIDDELYNNLKEMYNNFNQATKSCIDFKDVLNSGEYIDPSDVWEIGSLPLPAIGIVQLSNNSDNSPDFLNKGGVKMTWKDTMRSIANADKFCGIEIMELLQYMDFHLDRIIEAKACGNQKAIDEQSVFLNNIRRRLTELEYFPLVGGTSDLLSI